MQNGETDATDVANEFAAKTQGVLQALTDGDVTGDDLMQAWAQVGLPIVKALVLIVIVMIVGNWARRIVVKASTKAKVELTLAKFFGNMARWAILLLGALTILKTFVDMGFVQRNVPVWDRGTGKTLFIYQRNFFDIPQKPPSVGFWRLAYYICKKWNDMFIT